MAQTIYLLPGGCVDGDGTVHRETELVPLSGREEELLAENIHSGESASVVSSLLSRCVCRIGTISPLSEELASRLLVADRQYLLVKLRQLTYGDQVQAILHCPWPGCGSKIDIDFLLGDIPVRESKDKGPNYQMNLSAEAALIGDDGDKITEIAFRLPNGNDQEAVSPMLHKNEALAFTLLLQRCILKIGSVEQPGEELIYKLSPQARMEIEKQMENVSPKVDLTMEANCPECGRDFNAPFDLQKFFLGELQTSLDLLYREIHYLAYHYHWSEKEIIGMPKEKRHRYIEVLAEEIEHMNNEA